MANVSADGAQIFVVPYCHADWAWTHTRHWHAERYRLVFEETLALLRRQEVDGVPKDAPHAYRWYFDTFVTMLEPFLDRRPDLLPELQRRVHEGRIAICGTYVNMRPNCVEGEAFVRSLVLGRRQFQALFPHADLSVQADFADVAWGHAQLPQLLSLAGYRYLRGWRPHEALNAKGVPHHFIWQGVDGTEVLCSRGSYGGLVHRNFCPPDYRDRWGEVLKHWTEWHFREHEERSPVPLLWIAHGADDNRPLRTLFTSDAPMDLVGFIQEWNCREDSSRMGFATPVEVFAALEARRSALPTIAGTLDPCDVAYNAAFGGSEGLWRRRREAFRALLLAESLTVISTKAGAAPSTAYSDAAFDALWRAALTCSGHAQQWLFQDDFAELMSLAHATTWQARDLASRAAEALAAQVDLPERTVALVENPLAFERSVLVPLLVTFVEADQGGVPAALRLEDGRGLEVEYQIQNEMRHEGVLWELAVLARLALPAGGWNTISWKVDDTAAEEVNASTARSGTSTKPGARQLPEARPARLVLENELLRIELDQGRLVRVEDKETGLVDVAHAGLAYGHLCAYSVDATAPLHAGSITGQQDAEWLDWRMLETGPVRQAVLVLGRVGAHAVRVEIRLPTRERRIEFAMSVDWRGQDGFLAFHLPLPAAGELWGGIPYGAERKELANEPYVGFERSRPGMFWAQDFVDWTDGSRGVACLPHDGDVYYVFDDARNSLGHILINSFTRPADTWEKDVNREIEARGTHSFVTSLVWHPGDWRTAQLWSLSRSLTVSPVVVRRRHGQGPLPPYHSLLSIEPANVCLAALYQEGDATLARLYETAGQATTATLTFPAPVREATVVDLLNEPLSGAERDVGQAAPIAGTGGTDRRRLTCQLRPWQIRTIALRT